jgi:hypothetical protein
MAIGAYTVTGNAARSGVLMKGAAGTDTAIETADMALMADDLERIPYAVKLSKATRWNVLERLAVHGSGGAALSPIATRSPRNPSVSLQRHAPTYGWPSSATITYEYPGHVARSASVSLGVAGPAGWE